MLITAEYKNGRQKSMHCIIDIEKVKVHFEVSDTNYTRKIYKTLKKALKEYNKIIL